MDYVINKMLDILEANLERHNIQHFLFGLPNALGDDMLNGGVIAILPQTTEIVPIATGHLDEAHYEIKTVLAINLQRLLNDSGTEESGDAFAARVIEGRDENNQLFADTIIYIYRNLFKRFGVLNPRITVDYNTNELKTEGTYTARITSSITNIRLQPIQD